MDRRTRRILHHDELVMGTVVTFDLYDENEPSDVVFSLLQEAIDVLHEADDVFSTYKDDSPLSRLRRGEIAVEQCPKDVGDVLELCKVARTITDGWFDPWSIPGGVDPTGYVKGWAAPLDVLRHGAIHGAIVNAAGDTASFGGPQPGDRFRIGIVDPASTQRLACVVESPGAVATSGMYERGCHLIDPHTRRPASRAMSATVTGTDLGVADALATALAVGGVRALSLFEALDGYEALVIDIDNNFHTTAGFPTVSPHSNAST
ncbi:MAG: FAD:protein FMN transferase [Acidimicrobiales bacterium]